MGSLLKCDICYTELDRFHVVWMPERMANSNRVYPICFTCCDGFIRVYQKKILKYVRGREIIN